MLSSESGGAESAWTEGAYVPRGRRRRRVQDPDLPQPTGVGAAQPWPHEDTSHLWWRTARWLALAAIVVFAVAKITAPNRVVFDHTYDLVDPDRMIYAERGSPAAAGGWAQQAPPATPSPAPEPMTPSPRARRARRPRPRSA